MSTVDWIEVGTAVVPVEHRDVFLALIEGRSGDEYGDDGWGEARWVEPNGMHPMSPGMALEALIREFELGGIRQVSYNLAYECDDRTLQPGQAGDYTATYSALGVRRKTQDLWFLDTGTAVYPICIVDTTPKEEA